MATENSPSHEDDGLGLVKKYFHNVRAAKGTASLGRASSMNPMRRAEADARRRSTTNRRAKAASFAMPAISPVQGGRRSSQERGTRRGSAGK